MKVFILIYHSMKKSPTLWTQIEKPTKPKPNFLKIDFENPDFKRILNRTSFKDMGKIIDCANISGEEKDSFVIYLEDRVLFEMSINLNKLKWLTQLLVKLKPWEEFLKDFIIKLNDFLQSFPNSLLFSLNAKSELEVLRPETIQQLPYLRDIFKINNLDISDSKFNMLGYVLSINFILAKSKKKEFTSFAELLDLIKLSNYKNRAD